MNRDAMLQTKTKKTYAMPARERKRGGSKNITNVVKITKHATVFSNENNFFSMFSFSHEMFLKYNNILTVICFSLYNKYN